MPKPDKKPRGYFLGTPEYVYEKGEEPPALRAHDATTFPDRITYKKEYANDPEVQTHERIHAGQFKLGVQPSLSQVLEAINGFQNNRGWSESFGGNPAVELPAYMFSSPLNVPNPKEKQRHQEAFNNYINLMYRLSNRGSAPLEAAMPDALIRNYISRSPRPVIPPPVDMQPNNLVDLFRQILSGKK